MCLAYGGAGGVRSRDPRHLPDFSRFKASRALVKSVIRVLWVVPVMISSNNPVARIDGYRRRSSGRGDLDHDLASHVAFFDVAHGLRGFGQGNHAIDDRPELARCDQLTELLEVVRLQVGVEREKLDLPAAAGKSQPAQEHRLV